MATVSGNGGSGFLAHNSGNGNDNSKSLIPIQKEVVQLLVNRYKTLDVLKLDQLECDIIANKAGIVHKMVDKLNAKTSNQSKTDAIVSLVENELGYSVMQKKVDPTSDVVRKSRVINDDNSWKQKSDANKNKWMSLQPTSASLRCFKAVDASWQPTFVKFDAAVAMGGVTMTTIANLERCLPNFVPPKRPLVILVEALDGQKHIGNHSLLHDKLSAVRITMQFELTSGGDQARPELRSAWMISLGSTVVTFSPPRQAKLSASDVADLSLRIKREEADPDWYNVLRVAPTKILNNTLALLFGKQVAARIEPINTAYELRPSKPDEPDPGLVIGYMRLPLSDAATVLAMSGDIAGMVVSAAGGKKDSDYGMMLAPLRDDGGFKDIRELRKLLGDRYGGIVNISRKWDRYGVRIIVNDNHAALTEARTAIQHLTRSGPGESFTTKYVIEGVPRGTSKENLRSYLDTLSWSCVILTELRGKSKSYQTQNTTAYLLGSASPPPDTVLYCDGEETPLHIREFQEGHATNRQAAAWATRLYENIQRAEDGREADAAEAVKEDGYEANGEADDEEEDEDESDVDSPQADIERRTRLLVKRSRAMWRETRAVPMVASISTPQGVSSGSEDIMPQSKKSCPGVGTIMTRSPDGVVVQRGPPDGVTIERWMNEYLREHIGKQTLDLNAKLAAQDAKIGAVQKQVKDIADEQTKSVNNSRTLSQKIDNMDLTFKEIALKLGLLEAEQVPLNESEEPRTKSSRVGENVTMDHH